MDKKFVGTLCGVNLYRDECDEDTARAIDTLLQGKKDADRESYLEGHADGYKRGQRDILKRLLERQEKEPNTLANVYDELRRLDELEP